MFEALVIIFWFIVFYLGHKLYCAHKIKMMRKEVELLTISLVKNLAVFRPPRTRNGTS